MNLLAENLQSLMHTQHLSDAELARQTGISQPRITNIRNGRVKNPSIETLKNLADYFVITISQLVGEHPIEEAETPTLAHNRQRMASLLQDYQDIKGFLTSPRVYPKNIPIHSTPNEDVFCLRLEDKAMEPRFPKGSKLIFSPKRPIIDGDYVLIYFAKSKSLLFRQLLIDGEQKNAVSLNPRLNQSRVLDSKDKVLGVLIETHFVFD